MRKLYFRSEFKSSKILFITILIFFFNNENSFAQKFSEKLSNLVNIENAKFGDVKKVMNEIWQADTSAKKAGWKQYKRWENFWETRLLPDGNYPNLVDILAQWINQDKNMLVSIQTSDFEWKAVGPFNRAKKDDRYGNRVQNMLTNLGRINVVRFHPNNPNEIWAGVSTGGVWKSTNGGQSWYNFPFTSFMSLGVSDIAISPTNPDIVYVATGDHIHWGNTYSIGIIKTTDGGNKWELTNLAYQLDDAFKICRLLVHPNNPEIAITATTNGIFKTTDGGKSWEQKISGYFKDMEFMPGNPQIINAATYSTIGISDIFRSSDNGESWQSTNRFQDVRRIVMAVTSANPQKVYALCANQSYTSFHSFLVSNDGGQSWNKLSDSYNSPNILGLEDGMGNDENYGQGWYDLCIAVSPLDENLVFIGAINIWKSNNGGSDWEMVTNGVESYNKPDVHLDMHDLIYRDNSNELFVSNDGGIYKTTDDGLSWGYLSDGMNITQFYRLGCDVSNPDKILAGCQDNGTKMYLNGEWIQVGGGDGMEAICDYSNPDIIYISMQNGFVVQLNSTTHEMKVIFIPFLRGESSAWTTPFSINPVNPNVLYIGCNNLWKSSDKGDNWIKLSKFPNSGIIIDFIVSPTDTNYIYVAKEFSVYKSKDGGNQWEMLNSFMNPITNVEVSHSNPEVIWICFGGYDETNKVLKYDGNNWINLSGNLPNVPVNTIVCQKGITEKLYVGTDIGVFTNSDDSSNWEIYGKGLPNLIISELEIQYTSKKLRAATYGMGLWEIDVDIPVNIKELVDNQKKINVIQNPCSQLLITNYELLITSNVKIDIYNSLGNKITTLVDDYLEAGKHSTEFRTNGLTQGMYYCVYRINGNSSIQKFVILD
ncbi:MAG: T9SS type A sorting domain-containing protein [Bacteroidetes bacterium]|nr:MAG: T9SS type A sorting domain-containing protein [Bacteroidota bacterium]